MLVASLTYKTPLLASVYTDSLGLELGRLFRLEVELVPENLSVKMG